MADDLSFAYRLRDAVTRYLAAVDAWDRQYGQRYRMPSRSGGAPADLAHEEAEYHDARRCLEALAPRARLLYSRHGIRDPFNTLLRISLGAASPQTGVRASIGGNERTDVARGLVDLIAAAGASDPPLRPKPKSLWTQVRDLFR